MSSMQIISSIPALGCGNFHELSGAKVQQLLPWANMVGGNQPVQVRS